MAAPFLCPLAAQDVTAASQGGGKKQSKKKPDRGGATAGYMDVQATPQVQDAYGAADEDSDEEV
jgi:hypothetical protein